MYHYFVEFWDEIDLKTNTEDGLVGAPDWGTAAKEVSEYYGVDDIISMQLTFLENVLSADVVHENFKEAFATKE